jgi:hypothetical protein
VLAGIVDCSGAFVKPLSSLRSRSCVAATRLCIAGFIVQLPGFDESDRLLRAFVGVTVSAACCSFLCRSTKFAARGFKKQDVGASHTPDWTAVELFTRLSAYAMATVAFAATSSRVATSGSGRLLPVIRFGQQVIICGTGDQDNRYQQLGKDAFI